MAKWIKGLFSFVTDEQVQYLAGVLTPFNRFSSEAAVKAHRAAHAGLDIPALLIGLRAGEDRRKAMAAWKDDRLVDFVRRTLGREVNGLGDDSALTKHFANCWAAVQSSGAEGHVLASMRKMIACHARMGFAEIGKDGKTAYDLAEGCFA